MQTMRNNKTNPKLACSVLIPEENPPVMSQAALLTIDTSKHFNNYFVLISVVSDTWTAFRKFNKNMI